MSEKRARNIRVGVPFVASIRVRVVTGFALVILILLSIVVSTIALQHMNRAADGRGHQSAENAALFESINGHMFTAFGLFEFYLLTGDQEILDLFSVEAEAMMTDQERIRLRFIDQGREGDAVAIQRLTDVAKEILGRWESVAEIRERGEIDAAIQAFGSSILAVGDNFEEFSSLSESETLSAEQYTADARRFGDITFWLLVSSGGLGIIIALGTAYVVSRSVLGPITGLQNAAQAVSAGDLDFRAPVDGPREIAAVGAAFNEMTEGLLDASHRRELETQLQREHEQLMKAHEQLEETTSRLDGVLASTPDILYSISTTNFATLYVNAAVEKVYGRPPADFMKRPSLWMELVHPADVEAVEAVARRLMKLGSEETEFRIVRPDGSIRWIRSRMKLITDSYGIAVRIDGVHSDITEQRTAEEALRLSEERFKALVQNAQDVITVLAPDGTIQFESPSAKSILGYEPEELVGKRALDFVHPDDLNDVVEGLEVGAAHQGEPQRAEYRFKHKDGSWRYLESIGSVIEDESGYTMVINSRDVTERRHEADLIEYMAYHDALTKLPNRTLFEDRGNVALSQADRNGARVGIISIDVDRLKVINDTHGHPVGDDLLESVAVRLSKCVREGDTVARVGGDEFLAVLSSCATLADGEQVAARLVEAFSEPVQVEGHSLSVTVSVGLSMYPEDGDDLQTLVRKADQAMYEAKESGRNDYRVYASAEPEPSRHDGDQPVQTGRAAGD